MSLPVLRRSLSIAALAAAVLVASCTTPEPEAPPPLPPPPPPPPPAVTLNQGVAEAASIYVTFIRDVGTIRGGFPDAESVQAAMRKGAAYDPGQISRGMIAYASILALQSPEYVAGVRQYSVDPAQRRQMVEAIVADPAYAATLPGADAAAGLILSVLGRDIADLTVIADAVEGDAYTIQERNDPRRRWATQPIPNREARLESAKSISAGRMLPSAQQASQLFAAAHNGSGLGVSAGRSGPPYTPAVVNALAIAALASLGAAGEDARVNTDALSFEANSQFCFDMSKLNFFQCLAASRPSYEDMFCIGRHIVRDLATCTTTAVSPGPITVSQIPAQTPVPAPAVQTSTLNAAPPAASATSMTAALNGGSGGVF